MAITTTSVLPPSVQEHLHRTMLAVEVPNLIHNIGAMRVKAPRNSGQYTKFFRPNKLSTAPVPLGNSGVDPAPEALSAVTIDAKMNLYGKSVVLNEQVTLFSQSPVLNWATRMLGISLRETEDELTKSMLAATASSMNAVNGTQGDVPTEVTREDIENVILVLSGNNAWTMMDKITGEDKFGTGPVRNSYIVLAHNNVRKDLSAVAGFLNVSQYPSQSSVMRSEIGTVAESRWFLSSEGSSIPNASANGATVYNNFFVGVDSYGVITQDGYNSQMIYRDPKYSGALAQNATLAWKTSMAQAILNDQWIVAQRCVITT